MTELQALHHYLARLPFRVAGTGRKHDLVFASLDPIFRRTLSSHIATTAGDVLVDTNEPAERFLGYAFENVLRYYQRSPLGHYISRKAGGTFVDVGANLGMYSIVARLAGLRTIAIEPEPAHAAFLVRNNAVVGDTLAVGLSEEPGELPLFYDPRNSGATSLFEGPGTIRSDSTVRVETFGKLFADGSFGDGQRIELVKVDVEGFEREVVVGMTPFLELGFRPDVWCEVRGDRSSRNGGSFRSVVQILETFGYVAFDARHKDLRKPDYKALSRLGIFDLLFKAPAKTSGGSSGRP